jgi:hypothetical protein
VFIEEHGSPMAVLSEEHGSPLTVLPEEHGLSPAFFI